MRNLDEFADDLRIERQRLESAWSSLFDVWRDDQAQGFHESVVEPYRACLIELERAITELGEHLTETGQIQ